MWSYQAALVDETKRVPTKRKVRRIQPIQANAMMASITLISNKTKCQMAEGELTDNNAAGLVDLAPVKVGPQRLTIG